jgi:Domain of unknown function (DUF4389)
MNIDQDQIRANLLSSTFWVRILFMVIFALVLWALRLAVIVICVVQTVIVMITGEVNAQLQRLGAVTAVYVGQVVSFMLFATEDKPFPFTPFPEGYARPAAGNATGMPTAPTATQQDIAVLSEVVRDDPADDSFYDPERDSGATR